MIGVTAKFSRNFLGYSALTEDEHNANKVKRVVLEYLI